MFSSADIDGILSTMTVVYDTREQPTQLLTRRLNQIKDCGCKVAQEKNDYGDYTARFLLPSGEVFIPKVAIERKMGLVELSGCFFQNRDRFAREFQRCADDGAIMYLLVENASTDAIYKHHYNTKASPKSFIASLYTFMARYGCHIIFCDATMTGRYIYDILKYEGRVQLESYEKQHREDNQETG